MTVASISTKGSSKLLDSFMDPEFDVGHFVKEAVLMYETARSKRKGEGAVDDHIHTSPNSSKAAVVAELDPLDLVLGRVDECLLEADRELKSLVIRNRGKLLENTDHVSR